VEHPDAVVVRRLPRLLKLAVLPEALSRPTGCIIRPSSRSSMLFSVLGSAALPVMVGLAGTCVKPLYA
jgi:hypothetical protein